MRTDEGRSSLIRNDLLEGMRAVPKLYDRIEQVCSDYLIKYLYHRDTSIPFKLHWPLSDACRSLLACDLRFQHQWHCASKDAHSKTDQLDR